MDVLVPNSMKDAANCDKQCELQKSVNHQTSERTRHRWGHVLAVCLAQCLFSEILKLMRVGVERAPVVVFANPLGVAASSCNSSCAKLFVSIKGWGFCPRFLFLKNAAWHAF